MTITKLNLILALIFLGIIILVIPTPVFPGELTSISQTPKKASSSSNQEIKNMWKEACEKMIEEDPAMKKCDEFVVSLKWDREGVLLVKTRCVTREADLKLPKIASKKLSSQ